MMVPTASSVHANLAVVGAAGKLVTYHAEPFPRHCLRESAFELFPAAADITVAAQRTSYFRVVSAGKTDGSVGICDSALLHPDRRKRSAGEIDDDHREVQIRGGR